MDEITDAEMTLWLCQLRQGDDAAYSRLFAYYFSTLRYYIKPKLTSKDRNEGHDEDLGMECLERLWEDLKNGLFSELENENDLWFAIMRIANSLTINRRNFFRRKKRLVTLQTQSATAAEFERIAIATESEVFEFKEEWDGFVKSLPDRGRETIRMRIEGLDIVEIATQLAITPRSVQRILGAIRGKWERLVASLTIL